MKLEAILNKMIEQAPVLNLQVGTNAFLHTFPAECQEGIILREGFGGTEIDHEMPLYRKGDFQCIIRAKTQRRVLQIGAELQKIALQNATATGLSKLNYLRPKTEPFVYPVSPGNNWEALMNFDVCYVE